MQAIRSVGLMSQQFAAGRSPLRWHRRSIAPASSEVNDTVQNALEVGAKERTRVALMLDSFVVPAWVGKIITQLAGAEFVELALVLLNCEPSVRRPRFSRLRTPRRQHLLFNLYRRIDERLFGSAPNAFAPIDLGPLLATVPVVRAIPQRPKPFEHRFEAATIEQLRAAELDVMLRFGFNIIRGDILRCARFGVWSYHHGDNREYRGAPDFFWEMYDGSAVTGTLLQVLTEELDAGYILYRSFSATDAASLHRGRNAAYWKSAEFVLRTLTRLHKLGFDGLTSTPLYRERVSYEKPIYRTPTNVQMLRFIVRLLTGMATRQLRKVVIRDCWYIGYRPASRSSSPPPGTPVSANAGFHRFRGPRGRFYADPFVLSSEDRHYLFFEDYKIASRRGVISVCQLGRSGAGTPSVALERPYHLSYPCVFKSAGEWYMTPETRERRTIELFRADRLPDRWTLAGVLVEDVDAVDPTILEHEGRFWLFANIAVDGASEMDELCLFFADSLLTEWTPHPLNPVVSDVRRARPAGRVIARGDELFRPAQDCSVRYGGAVVFNRIDRLTMCEYSETPIARLEPSWLRGNLATHTFNSDGAYEVVDGQRPTIRPLDWTLGRLAREASV